MRWKLLNKKFQGRRLEAENSTHAAKYAETFVAETIDGADALGLCKIILKIELK